MSQHKVVIIGAGVAGCTAARTLIQNGIHDIVVLEATDRIGGRVKTFHHGPDEQVIDLGAQWIHGDINNPLYEELNARGLVRFKGEYLVWGENTADTRNCYDSQGGRLDKATVNKGLELSELLDDIIDEEWEPGTDIEQFKREHFEKLCRSKGLSTVEQALCRKVLIWIEKTDKAEEASEKWDRSEKTFDCGQYDDSGNKDFTFTEGAYSIFDHLLLPAIGDKIKLKVEVSKVNYSCNTGVVSVHTNNGDMYTAEHVIVTSSVNYMKNNHQQMFHPPLPEEKASAIQQIWMGVVEKFIFYYENPFWREESERNVEFRGYGLLIDEDDEKKLSADMQCILGHQADWWKYIANISTVLTNSHILSMELSNKSALQAAKCTDEQIVQVVHCLLKHFVGVSPPQPSKLFRTSWGTDKHFLGSYSSEMSEHFSPQQSKTMMEPIYCNNSPVVLFAGEAYHHKWMSTLHGAYDTGIQQANKIAQYILEKQHSAAS